MSYIIQWGNEYGYYLDLYIDGIFIKRFKSDHLHTKEELYQISAEWADKLGEMLDNAILYGVENDRKKADEEWADMVNTMMKAEREKKKTAT